MSQNNKIEEKVMAEIKSGKIKLRSRYIFLAEKLSLSSAFVFSAFLAVLFFSLTLFYLQSSDNLDYLSFGSRGLVAFLETFPYLLVVSLIISIFIAGFILKKSDLAYKESFGCLSWALLAVVVIAGVVLTFTSLGENIEKRSYGCCMQGKVVRPFLHQEFIERERGIAGRVTEMGANFLNVQTPLGIKKIDLMEISSSTVAELKPGVFVMAIGEKKSDVFFAKNLRVVNEGEMPMIRRGVDERFGPPKDRMPPSEMEDINCVGDCLMKKNVTSSCMNNCFIK